MSIPGARRGSTTYFASLIVSQCCALIRYVVMARLLGPEQLGLAVVIVLAAQFFDSITDSGADRFLIQDRDGHRHSTLSLIHLVAIGRGVLIAVLLLLLAGPIAAFAGAPQLTGALRTLAIVPLIAGVTHFGFRLAQRTHDFTGEARILLSSEIVGLLGTIAGSIILQDFRAILCGLIARGLAMALASHATSPLAYRLHFGAEIAQRLWRFGMPLMFNGLLLFIATQSDRIIIGRMLGWEELGRYSALLLLMFYPTATIMRFIAAIFLPRLAACQDQPRLWSTEADRLGGICLMTALLIATGFAILAPPITPLLFGTAFHADPALAALMAVLMAWRLIKVAPTTIALSAGRTGIVLANNVLRLSAVPFALLGLRVIGGVEGAVAGLIAGEIVANLSATLMVNANRGWGRFRDLDRYALFAGSSAALILAASGVRDANSGLHWAGLAGAAALLALAGWRERRNLAVLHA